MTLTERRSIARKHLRYGHYHTLNPPRWYVLCPRCRAEVDGYPEWNASTTRVERALVAALVEHLGADCSATGEGEIQ